jgi:hypothetical protein
MKNKIMKKKEECCCEHCDCDKNKNSRFPNSHSNRNFVSKPAPKIALSLPNGFGKSNVSSQVEKPLKVYFCPNCESKEVGYVFRFGNAFGVIPKMECKKCGFHAMGFPQLVINMDQLNKIKRRGKK